MSEFTMDRLRENLESLKMKNTLEILNNYLERAVAENLNIVDVLDHIFSEEAKSKRKRAYEKQIQMSGFPIRKTLDDFDFSFQPSIDKRQIDELATMRFLENGENVVFLGPPGVGKTHLASALGLVAARHRFSTYYINCHQLIEQLKKVWISRAQISFSSSLPDGMRKRLPFSLQTKPSLSGTRSLPTLPSPPLFWTAFCIIVPLSISRVSLTA